MSKKRFDDLLERVTLGPAPALWPPYNAEHDLAHELLAISPEQLFDEPITQPDLAACTVAGLLLFADCLAESHHISQSIASSTGSYWHAIMHRREPDYSNARYWFNRVGQHEAFSKVYTESLHALDQLETAESDKLKAQIGAWGQWNPEGFIELCELAYTKNAGHRPALEAVQKAEMTTLLKWCHENATQGKPSADTITTGA